MSFSFMVLDFLDFLDFIDFGAWTGSLIFLIFLTFLIFSFFLLFWFSGGFFDVCVSQSASYVVSRSNGCVCVSVGVLRRK